MQLYFGHVEFLTFNHLTQEGATVKTYRLRKYILGWTDLRYCWQVAFDMSDIKLLGCVVRKTDMNSQLICSSPQN